MKFTSELQLLREEAVCQLTPEERRRLCEALEAETP